MTAPGLPVIIATNGRGVPVTVVTNGLGVPIQTSTNGHGIPIVVKASGGLPVQYVGDVNLLAGLSWVPGANTTLSIAAGRARATIGAGANPRIWKQVDGLTIGATYHVAGTVYAGTQTGDIFFRVSSNSAIPDGNNYGTNNATTFVVNADFVATATTLYVGFVAITSAPGQYAEIDDNFSMTLV